MRLVQEILLGIGGVRALAGDPLAGAGGGVARGGRLDVRA